MSQLKSALEIQRALSFGGKVFNRLWEDHDSEIRKIASGWMAKHYGRYDEDVLSEAIEYAYRRGKEEFDPEKLQHPRSFVDYILKWCLKGIKWYFKKKYAPQYIQCGQESVPVTLIPIPLSIMTGAPDDKEPPSPLRGITKAIRSRVAQTFDFAEHCDPPSEEYHEALDRALACIGKLQLSPRPEDRWALEAIKACFRETQERSPKDSLWPFFFALSQLTRELILSQDTLERRMADVIAMFYKESLEGKPTLKNVASDLHLTSLGWIGNLRTEIRHRAQVS